VPLPVPEDDGSLPPGIHAAALRELEARFGVGSEPREQQIELLRRIVEAARPYASIKRVLVWGSFVTAKPELADLDYSVVVGVSHERTAIRREHRRFFVPIDARRYYGTDKAFLVIKDYPLDVYIDRLDFICRSRERLPRGIVEVSLRGEFSGETE
jgi:hypothetical protein